MLHLKLLIPIMKFFIHSMERKWQAYKKRGEKKKSNLKICELF